LIEREGEGCCDADGREEGVAHRSNLTAIRRQSLSLRNRFLDLVTVAIKALAAFERGFAAFGWWNAGRDVRGFKRFAKP